MGRSASKCCREGVAQCTGRSSELHAPSWETLPPDMLFPMWLVSVENFIAMEGTPKHHQELMECELLTKWTPGLFTVFVSHQWSSIEHPDLEGKQLAVLRQALQSIISGSLGVATTIEEEAVFNYSKRMPVHTREALRKGYLWIDWFAVPQLRHGCVEADLKQDMSDAINSIPSYVTKADLFVVIAPMQHHNETDEVLDFNSWHDRGWCRVELACRALAECEDSNEIIVINSGTEARYASATEWMFAPPGDGNFSVDRDRKSLFPVIRAAIDRKIEHELTAAAKNRSDPFRVRMYTGMRSIVSARLIDDNAFRSRASYNSEDDEVAFLRKFHFDSLLDKGENGLGPLMCAVLEDNLPMIGKILDAGVHVESRITKDVPDFFLISQTTPLSLAAFMGLLNAVRVLLGEKADVHSTQGFQATPLHNAVFGGRHTTRGEIVNLLMDNDADPEKRNLLGMTVLAVACMRGQSDGGVECVRNLLQRRARVEAVDNQGQTALHLASLFGGKPEVVQLLIKYGSAINQKIVPATIVGGIVLNVGRLGVYFGTESSFLQHFGEARGETAMHVAAFRANKDIYSSLLLARADPTIQNARGHTALDLAKRNMPSRRFSL